jgi:hypothetical protein
MVEDLAGHNLGSRQARVFRWVMITLTVVADLLAIGAFALGLTNRDRINDLVADASGWYVSVSLSGPPSGADVEGHMIQITGKIEFQDTAKTFGDVALALQHRRVDLLPFVRAARVDGWWAQASVLIRSQPSPSAGPPASPDPSAAATDATCTNSSHPCGTFTGTVQLGELGIGIGEQFQIVVLALPKASVSKGDKLNNLPFSYATSQGITVRRTR